MGRKGGETKILNLLVLRPMKYANELFLWKIERRRRSTLEWSKNANIFFFRQPLRGFCTHFEIESNSLNAEKANSRLPSPVASTSSRPDDVDDDDDNNGAELARRYCTNLFMTLPLCTVRMRRLKETQVPTAI